MDKKIYTFKHKRTDEIYTGTRNNFIKKFNLPKSNVSKLISGKHKTVKFWYITSITIIVQGNPTVEFKI
jgi:hypothetical protein